MNQWMKLSNQTLGWSSISSFTGEKGTFFKFLEKEEGRTRALYILFESEKKEEQELRTFCCESKHVDAGENSLIGVWVRAI
jgi:hypothetical protein